MLAPLLYWRVMTVKALRMGYFNHRRQKEGMTFQITDLSQFSHRWMEAVDFVAPPEKGPRIPFLGQHIPTVKENDKAPMAFSKASKPTGEQQVI